MLTIAHNTTPDSLFEKRGNEAQNMIVCGFEETLVTEYKALQQMHPT